MKFNVVADCGPAKAACLEFKDLVSRADADTKRLVRALTPDSPALLAEVIRSYRRDNTIHVEIGPSDLLVRILEILYSKVKPLVPK